MSIQAVVFDWAGTVIDHGSLAPVGAFVEAFARAGVTVSAEEVRRPMGLPKLDHLRALLADAAVAARWRAARGRTAAESDIQSLYDVFEPLNVAVVEDYADMVPGAVAAADTLRRRGIKIGTTTGYTREIMDRLLPLAAAQRFVPDNVVCASDVARGRPGPMMMYRCFLDLDVAPASAVIKVDDTVPGIAEGLAAGCWTVGVAETGNGMGLGRADLEALEPDARRRRAALAGGELLRSGAHYVVASVSDLMPVVDAVEGRLRRGERP
jgi:phosphonoacetaldehyde hydrolase